MWARTRGAAAICGTTHKTVKRIVEALELLSGGSAAAGTAGAELRRGRRAGRGQGGQDRRPDHAKRLLPFARAARYEGSDRHFRRLVADAKQAWRQGQARAGGRRPAVWSPGEVLAIDWGTGRFR